MQKAMIYLHGQGGSAEEAEHFKPIFKRADVMGFDYQSKTPWEAKEEFRRFYDSVSAGYESVSVIANSIGAYFTMVALSDRCMEKAMFISPIVNMEKLISDMMMWENVTEKDLETKKEIATSFGETLSWEYLCYVREHPVKWTVSTEILYGEKDHFTSYETMLRFSRATGAAMTVMKDGEHWFHTAEQMQYLDEWICRFAESTPTCMADAQTGSCGGI